MLVDGEPIGPIGIAEAGEITNIATNAASPRITEAIFRIVRILSTFRGPDR
jgi:hypothetical protein